MHNLDLSQSNPSQKIYPSAMNFNSRFRGILYLTVFIGGALFWIQWFSDAELIAYDWNKENFYLNVLRTSIESNVVPWELKETTFHKSPKFLANPEIPLTPDLLLLPLLSNKAFVIMHTLIFYGIGFWGIRQIGIRIKASFITFCLVWLLFNFNGYIISHLAVGHFQWTGYFLLPLFFCQILNILELPQPSKAQRLQYVYHLALILGLLFLNGSFHIAVWCMMVLGFTSIGRWSIALEMLSASFLGFLLGCGRLIPAALFFPKLSEFNSGYPSLLTYLNALITVQDYKTTHVGAGFSALGWWEFNIYIGLVGLIVVLGCVGWGFHKDKIETYLPLIMATIYLLYLSFDNVYLFFSRYIPLFDVERVSSRFIIMPLTLVLIGVAIGAEKFIKRWPSIGSFILLLAMFKIAYDLFQHSQVWRIAYIDQAFKSTVLPPFELVESTGLYKFWTIGSWSASLLVFIFIWFSYKSNMKKLYFIRH